MDTVNYRAYDAFGRRIFEGNTVVFANRKGSIVTFDVRKVVKHCYGNLVEVAPVDDPALRRFSRASRATLRDAGKCVLLAS